MMRTLGLALVVVWAAAASACGGSPKMVSARMAATTAPVQLDRSVFARDPNGQLSEEALQQILASPLELDLPARVGVLPIVTATDWRGPNPDYKYVPAGVGAFVKKLRGSEPFTLVTEVMPIPSGALGMEALREIAARYRLRYVLLYREVIQRRTRLNPFAWGYLTIVGALFIPGQSHVVAGYLEASLFDVKTGLLLFTTRRSVRASQTTNVWYQNDKLDEMQAKLAYKFAPDLADDVRMDVARFAEAAKVENERRFGGGGGGGGGDGLPPEAPQAKTE
jgi:rhombotail lipoprotein